MFVLTDQSPSEGWSFPEVVFVLHVPNQRFQVPNLHLCASTRQQLLPTSAKMASRSHCRFSKDLKPCRVYFSLPEFNLESYHNLRDAFWGVFVRNWVWLAAGRVALNLQGRQVEHDTLRQPDRDVVLIRRHRVVQVLPLKTRDMQSFVK